ncbi:MAG: DUF1211 domain-containing protein [Gemmatimonadetes bacterium]|nr:DUF1211 domain-containing protein [Gemmatimonadota bacterium]
MAEGTGRVEAFSDGVFAIAITLLILEIRLPESGATPGLHPLWTGLAGLWPSYLAFALSFFVILIMWVNHHELMRMVRVISDVHPETIARVRKANLAGPVVYTAATLVAFFQPVLGLAVNVSLWILWIRLCSNATHTAADRHAAPRPTVGRIAGRP